MILDSKDIKHISCNSFEFSGSEVSDIGTYSKPLKEYLREAIMKETRIARELGFEKVIDVKFAESSFTIEVE